MGRGIEKIIIPKGDARVMGLERSGRIRVLVRRRPFPEKTATLDRIGAFNLKI